MTIPGPTVHRGETYELPRDQVYLTSPIRLKPGAILRGQGHTTPGWGTTVRPHTSFPGGPLIICEDFWHWGAIENVTVFGDRFNMPGKVTDGIRCQNAGEGSIIRDVMLYGCENGARFGSGGPANATSQAGFAGLDNVTAHRNHVGINLDGVFSRIPIRSLSGDNNVNALLRISGKNYHEVSVDGIKCEAGPEGAEAPVILVDNWPGYVTTLTVRGGHLVGNGIGDPTPECVRILGGDVNMAFSGVHMQDYGWAINHLPLSREIPVELVAREAMSIFHTESNKRGLVVMGPA